MDGSLTHSNRIRWVSSVIEKLGAAGAIFAAAAAPCCFPLLASVAGTLGIGSIPFLRGNAPAFIQSMTALALLGQVVSYRQYRKCGPLIVSAMSAVLVAIAYLLSYHPFLVYGALAGFAAAAIWNVFNRRRACSCSFHSNRPTPNIDESCR